METSGIADRVALLAHEHLIRMYEGMGFVDKGKSAVKFGGGGWTDLVGPNGFEFLVQCRLTNVSFTNFLNMGQVWRLGLDRLDGVHRGDTFTVLATHNVNFFVRALLP